MIPITNITGRLGNQMFQFAFFYSYAREHGLDYYFQDPFYFEEYANDIRTLFSEGIKDPIDAVAIHVRRGANPLQPNEPKYIDNQFYVNICATDYYERAIAMFPGETFYVFSDDMAWCKEKWGHLNNFVFHSGSEIDDLNTMAACKAHIIPNSTFSWWGAWLSPQYPNNRVVVPKQWFTDGIERTVTPDHWIRI